MAINLNRLRWEFWPIGLIYLPIYPYWLWLSLRSGSFFFFSAANPRMAMGGMFGASKHQPLSHLPLHYVPKTFLFLGGDSFDLVSKTLANNNINYPLIFKPDRLERGKGVCLVKNESQLQMLVGHATFDFLIQEYIAYDFEAAVFYQRLPGTSNGRVTSVATKDFLTVTGDGSKTLGQLLAAHSRAKMQVNRLRSLWQEAWHNIPEAGKKILIEPIGNHNRGTVFNNANHLISDNLSQVFHEIAIHIPEFYYGRFDLRCTSETDFLAGKNIKIVEVNGANAEPVHMYDPATKPWQGWWALLKNWRELHKISMLNKARGFHYASAAEATKYRELQQAARKSI